MQSLQLRSCRAGPQLSCRADSRSSSITHKHACTQAVSTRASAGAESAPELARRQIVALPLLLPAASLLWGGAARAEEEPSAPASQARVYVDDRDKYTITVPSGWEQGTGDMSEPNRFSNAAGLRRVVAWYPSSQADVSVAVTSQPIGPDFTGLGSFGRAEDFGQGVVNAMDRSYLLRAPAFTRSRLTEPIVVAKLLEAKEEGGKYYVSYTVERLADDGSVDERRTVYSVVAMGSNGTQNRLFTVNASTKEPGLARFGGDLQSAVASFRAPPKA